MTFVKRVAGAAALGGALLLGSGPFAPQAQAGYVVTLEEVRSDVVATGRGRIDLGGLISLGRVGDQAGIFPMNAEILTGLKTPAECLLRTYRTDEFWKWRVYLRR